MDLAAQLFLEGIPRKEIPLILEMAYRSISRRLQRRGMSKRKELEVREHTRKKSLRTDHTFHAFI